MKVNQRPKGRKYRKLGTVVKTRGARPRLGKMEKKTFQGPEGPGLGKVLWKALGV